MVYTLELEACIMEVKPDWYTFFGVCHLDIKDKYCIFSKCYCFLNLFVH